MRSGASAWHEAEGKPPRKRRGTDRLAAVELAHDVNNLLQAIVLQAQVAQGRVAAGNLEGVGDLLQDIVGVCGTGSELAARLMATLGRGGEPTTPTLRDLHEDVSRSLSLVCRLLPPAVDVRCELGARDRWTRVPPGDLSQLLLNLALNAREAMPRGGSLTLRTENRSPADDATAPYVCLAVIDAGVGMSAEVRRRAVERFFTTRPNGTGLGLAIVEGIVQRAGGRLVIHSAPGEDTRVEAFLPVSPARA
jgi:signal transduction histidine kinase